MRTAGTCMAARNHRIHQSTVINLQSIITRNRTVFTVSDIHVFHKWIWNPYPKTYGCDKIPIKRRYCFLVQRTHRSSAFAAPRCRGKSCIQPRRAVEQQTTQKHNIAFKAREVKPNRSITKQQTHRPQSFRRRKGNRPSYWTAVKLKAYLEIVPPLRE